GPGRHVKGSGWRIPGAVCCARRLHVTRRGAHRVTDLSDETKPTLPNSSYQFLGGAVIANCLPRGFDAAVERRLRHGSAVPDTVNDLVLGDKPVAVLDQQDQQVEDLGLDGHNLAIAPNLISTDIDQTVVDAKDHWLVTTFPCCAHQLPSK